MYNEGMKKMYNTLEKEALVIKAIAEELGDSVNTLHKKEKKTKKEELAMENAEYAYSYIKDALEGVSRIRVAVKHADIFYNEYNNGNTGK